MELRWSPLLLACFVVPAAFAWDSQRLPARLLVQGLQVPHAVFAIYPLPGDEIRLRWQDGSPGRVRYLGSERATGNEPVRAPRSPGLTRMEIVHEPSGQVARINVFTVVPHGARGKDGMLNGYRMGHYPEKPLRGQEIYLPPRGFVEVTEKNAQTRVSPNFRVGQFVSKQQGGYPKYVVLQPELLLKLETILAQLNRQGRATQELVIMSGYRTPYYNRSIGNVPYSRHVWGGAADIYIDQAPRDGRMDDLDGNGRIDIGDARWFADFVDRLSDRGLFGKNIGGLGVYGANAAHGPFIHVDVRGQRARW